MSQDLLSLLLGPATTEFLNPSTIHSFLRSLPRSFCRFSVNTCLGARAGSSEITLLAAIWFLADAQHSLALLILPPEGISSASCATKRVCNLFSHCGTQFPHPPPGFLRFSPAGPTRRQTVNSCLLRACWCLHSATCSACLSPCTPTASQEAGLYSLGQRHEQLAGCHQAEQGRVLTADVPRP